MTQTIFNNSDTNSLAQSNRSRDGRSLELDTIQIISHLEEILETHHISILDGHCLSTDRPDVYNRISFRSLNGLFVGDIDIVLYDEYKHEPVLIISTKTSFRERFYESLCTLLMYKVDYPRIQVWVVTNDNGRMSSDKKWHSELGTDISPTKQRQLGAYYHIPIYSRNPQTSFGGGVKPISMLCDDIKRVFCK